MDDPEIEAPAARDAESVAPGSDLPGSAGPASPSDRPASGPGAGYLPFGAYAAPSTIVPPPRPPAWAHAYELPSARQVVNAGLQLAQRSNRSIRRASIYIGLLSFGAFGPAAVLLLVGIARLLGDPETAGTVTGNNPFLVFAEQPELGAPLALIAGVALIGLVLLVAISIDAQAMAIALLGGVASEQPLAIREALARARQTFWRLFWSGVLVNLLARILALAMAWPFLRPNDSNQGLSFITQMIATIAVTPFAFAATGIVLGDAGAIETLRRSVRLFRARPRIALVVTLFTLVTAAIQGFAFGSGADLAARVAGFFHLGEGATSLILPGVLVLALIVAFGSLTMTIAAIVAAPQVAAFLGLTFYAGGLDVGRAQLGEPARRVRWVSTPMTIVMAGLAVVVLFGIPTIASYRLRSASPLVAFLRGSAADRGTALGAIGASNAIEDRSGDVLGVPDAAASSDIVSAEVGWFPETPDWLLLALDCARPGVTCPARGSDATVYGDGAIVFLQRMAAPIGDLPAGRVGEWGPLLTIGNAIRGSAFRNVRYPGASDAFITQRDSGTTQLLRLRCSSGARFLLVETDARSAIVGTDLVTVVPIREIDGDIGGWDAYAGDRAQAFGDWSYDILRAGPANPFLPLLPATFMTAPTFGA